MSDKEDKNITGETWKFQSREVPIKDMDKVSVLYAAIHAFKRMHYYNKQYHYAEYRIKTADNDKERARFERKIKKSDDLLLFFANKLEHLEARALALGFEIPEKYEDVKELLSKTEKEVEEKK